MVVPSSRVVARCSCCRTDRRWACTSIVQPSSCLAVGRTVLWGQKWLHWVWGPCLVVGAQGDTLKAWVVKLLGGLSASARAQRTFDSLFLWRVFTLLWGSLVQSDGNLVGAQVAWVVKLLGGLSVSACAQRTFDSLFLWRVLTLQWGSQVQSEENVVGAQEAWVVKLLGGLSASAVHKELLRVHTLKGPRTVGGRNVLCGKSWSSSSEALRLRSSALSGRQAAWRPGAFVDKLCQRRSVHFSCPSWRLSGLGVYAPNARSTNSLSMARVCGSKKKKKEPSSVWWCSWAIHS